MANQMVVYERMVDEAEFIANTGATVRETAKHFGVSKSTVFRDCTERLENAAKSDFFCMELFERTRQSIMVNKQERYIRGGAATKAKKQAVSG